MLRAAAIGFLFALAYLAIVAFVMLGGCDGARAHDWFPADCCSGFDCKVIPQSQVQASKGGFVIPGNPEVVPYSSPKIRQTPPEGANNFAVCTTGGAPDGAVICLYIPTWGS